MLESADPHLVLIETFSVSRDRFGEDPQVLVEALDQYFEVPAILFGRLGDFPANLSKLPVRFSLDPHEAAVHRLEPAVHRLFEPREPAVHRLFESGDRHGLACGAHSTIVVHAKTMPMRERQETTENRGGFHRAASRDGKFCRRQTERLVQFLPAAVSRGSLVLGSSLSD